MKARYIQIVILLVGLSSCHSGYTEKDGKIYFKWIHGGNWTREYSLVEGADPETFSTINHSSNSYLAKDKNHVYIEASVLAYADPATFEQIKDYYWKDKSHVFLLQFGGDTCVIKDADPSTFKILGDENWGRDKQNVYFKFDKLPNCNASQFTVINEDWGKDDKRYFYNYKPVNLIDYPSARVLSNYYIIDKNHVFCQDSLMPDADVKTFMVEPDGDGSFGHDKTNMFRWYTNEGPITPEYRQMYMVK